MKISVNWLQEFTDIKLDIDELVAKIGAQLGEIEEVTALGEQYQDVVVVKVVSVKDHPDADRLHVCLVDDGGATKGVERNGDGLVQVVCGAPNVREGLFVAWLPPGSIVPSTYETEQFKLEARPLRGVVSNGMLASGHELAINDNHEGILEVDIDCLPGTAFAEVYNLNDVIIDIENKMFTHRPDCFGILGVAREVAGIQHIPFNSPNWYQEALDVTSAGNILPLEVTNEIPELVPRFMMVPIAGLTVAPSSIMAQTYLTRVGIKPINNVVDVTNLVMYLTAQPLHAFDYDKVAALDGSKHASIVVRKPKKSEKIALLNGKTIEPRADAIMIASTKYLLAVGGVMGGKDTEVDNNTKNIILECATFDMYSIRKTSMANGLFTDAVTRFNKGQSPLQNDKVLGYAVSILQDITGGQVAGKVHDLKHGSFKQSEVAITPHFINERLGLQLNSSQVAKHLEDVEFSIKIAGDELHVLPSFWRTDIAIPEDIVEEVGRLIGFDNLPLVLPARSITPAQPNPLLSLKSTVRGILARAGANEVLTYSFVHGNILEKAGQNLELAYQLSNALSPDLQYYRLSLIPSLLDKVHSNIKAGYDEFALFEINKSHDKSNIHEDGLPIEEERLALVVAADKKVGNKGSAYYQAKEYVTNVLEQLGYTDLVFEPTTTHQPKLDTGKQALAPFERNRSAYIKTGSGILVGIVGEFKASVRKNFKLPDYVAGFELDLLMVQQYKQAKVYKPLSRYPSTTQDISFKVDDSVSYQLLASNIQDSLQKATTEHGYVTTIKPLDIYRSEAEKTHKHIAFRISLTHYNRTLTTEEVNKLLDELATHAKSKLKAARL
jgi:phenylalanyl-tRNA synthetase beta chain